MNITVSIASRVILLVVALCVRRLLIQYLGNDINGLNSLYASTIGMLTVAELGVGSVIVFSMGRPIAAGDRRLTAALYDFYRRLYRIIAALILGFGLAMTPLLPLLIGDDEKLGVNVYATFLLTLAAVVLSYVYSARTSLIEAHGDGYLTTGILTASRLVRYGMQIAAILIWSSYTIFLVCQIIETLLIWGLTERLARGRYRKLLAAHERVDRHTKADLTREVKAALTHRLGPILVIITDALIISAFLGVVVLGKYVNYALFALVVANVGILLLSPFTSTVEKLCAAGDEKKTRRCFSCCYSMNYILGFVLFLGYYAVIDNVVVICFGKGLGIAHSIVFVITLNQFIQYMRSTSMMFRSASSARYYGRWEPIVECAVNLGLALLFVRFLPEDHRLVWIIAATIITTLIIGDVVEPYAVFRRVFGRSCKAFCLKNYAYTALFILGMLVMDFLRQPFTNDIGGFLANGSLSAVVSLIALSLVAALDQDFRKQVRFMAEKFPAWVEKKTRR